jgi:hypothetical protein
MDWVVAAAEYLGSLDWLEQRWFLFELSEEQRLQHLESAVSEPFGERRRCSIKVQILGMKPEQLCTYAIQLVLPVFRQFFPRVHLC